MKKDFKIIGFDADDTLWENEPFYRETEKKFCQLLSNYNPEKEIMKELYKIEMSNLSSYGYGIKSFVLSMIETATKVSKNSVSTSDIDLIISLGKEMINKPVKLLVGVKEVLQELADGNYKLIVATKGDLLDQERKLRKSGLDGFFHHIEIMSDKKEPNYSSLLSHLDISADEFLMIGNSMKSDIIPVVSLGGWAVHIPYHTTWIHEVVDGNYSSPRFSEINQIENLLPLLKP